MANQEHLDLIRQGVKVWNAWRKQHPETKAILTEVDLTEINLSGADLSGTDLSGADLNYADLGNAYIREATLRNANLSGANLNGANLREADLSLTFLSGSDLSLAVLSKANLSGAVLYKANLSGANLREATFRKANLRRADFSGANLSGANLSYARIGWTSFGDCDLRTITGLETIQHDGPSFLSINTIYYSEGDIPEAFVRGTGAPDSFIEYMRALAAKPIQYYTCFISYSSKDQDFAERLYADLQSNNVRCWYAPEDMKIGDKIRQRIDESIRLYDKLLLVLSQHSVMSSWVEAEVEAAFEKERGHKKSVLFPIMLDDAVMRTNEAWAADISRTRHIGDFTCWKEYDAYQRGLKRLLRDLKAENTMREI